MGSSTGSEMMPRPGGCGGCAVVMVVSRTDAESMFDSDHEGDVGFVAAAHHTKFSLCMATAL